MRVRKLPESAARRSNDLTTHTDEAPKPRERNRRLDTAPLLDQCYSCTIGLRDKRWLPVGDTWQVVTCRVRRTGRFATGWSRRYEWRPIRHYYQFDNVGQACQTYTNY